ESDRIVPSSASSDLGVSIESPQDATQVGQSLQYTVTLTNAGPNHASSVLVRMNLSAGQSVTSTASNDGTITVNGNTVNFFLAELAAGSFARFNLNILATQAGTLICDAAIS